MKKLQILMMIMLAVMVPVQQTFTVSVEISAPEFMPVAPIAVAVPSEPVVVPQEEVKAEEAQAAIVPEATEPQSVLAYLSDSLESMLENVHKIVMSSIAKIKAMVKKEEPVAVAQSAAQDVKIQTKYTKICCKCASGRDYTAWSYENCVISCTEKPLNYC